MTIRTTRPSFVAPHALVFVFLMNMGALAAFKWTSSHEPVSVGAEVSTLVRADARVPAGASGAVSAPAAAIRPAAAVPGQDSVGVRAAGPTGRRGGCGAGATSRQ